jgi:hypothetical protein
MSYVKNVKKDTVYRSVNHLIQTRKYNGLSVIPPYAAGTPAKAVQAKSVTDLTAEPEKAPMSEAVPVSGTPNASESKHATAGPETEQPDAPMSAETVTLEKPAASEEEAMSAGPVTPAGQQTEPEAGSAEIKTEPFELNESEIDEGPKEEKETGPEQQSAVLQQKNGAAGAPPNLADPDPGARFNHPAAPDRGEVLPEAIRTQMGEALGMDFQNVRLHRDTRTATVAVNLGARAFTKGEDIYFNRGEYNPDTGAGRHLIAHELTHVKQQRTIPGLQYKLAEPAERDRYEREADAAADRATGAIPTAGIKASAAAADSGLIRSVAGVQCKDEGDSGWVLRKVGEWLRNIPGYEILTLIIGRDPVTGREVKRDGSAFVKAIVGLIPGGKMIMANLEKANIIPRVASWFKAEFQKLNISFQTIKNLFSQAWKTLSTWDLLNPSGAFAKLKNIFTAPVKRVLNFIAAAGSKMAEFVFEGALTLIGAPVKMVMGVLNQGKNVLKQIINDPIGFFRNLANAVKGGLGNFAANIKTHLQNGIGGWLFGALGKAGLTMPEKFNLAGIFSIVSQILGVTWRAIRAIVVKRLGPAGEKVMGLVEKSVAFVAKLITQGPLALLEMAREFIGELPGMFFGSLIEWVRNTIIVKAVQKLISMFNPVGAIIQAVIAIYNTVQFFIERAKQIAAFVGAVFNSIAEIAGGNIGKAIAAVENALAKALPVFISFLANLIGLGGIAAKIKEIIRKIRKPIEKAVGKIVGLVVGKAKTLINKAVNVGKGVAGGVKDWWKVKKDFTTKDGEKHTLFFEGEGKNAILIMQSEPIAISDFLSKVKNRNNPQAKKYIANAEKIFFRIKSLRNELSDKITGKRMNNDIADNEKQEQGFFELKQLLVDLTDTLSYIQVDFQNGEFPPVIYPPFVNHVKASDETKVAYLNKVNGFVKGSTSSLHSGKLPGWDKIEEYELINGRGGTFVKMHLIPQCLGGYATDSNLTPGEAKLNSTLRDQVEQPAKEAISGKQDMIWYEVRLTYHTEEEYQDFISSIHVQWGYYLDKKDGKWEKSKKVEKDVNQSVVHPVFDVEVININEECDAKKVRNSLKISKTKAELIIEERKRNGKYQKVDDIFGRVEKLSPEQRNSINKSFAKRFFYF